MAAPSANGHHLTPTPDDLSLDRVERGFLEKALAQSNGNKSQAARVLGLTRSQLYSRLQKHGLR